MKEHLLQQYLSSASLLLQDKQYRKALPYLLNAYRISPVNADITFHIADAFRQLGEFEQAARFYAISVKNRPDFSAAYSNLGAVHRELGNYSEAVSNLEKAVALSPNSVESLCNLGLVLREKGDVRKALEYFDQAITHSPQRSSLRILYAETAVELGLIADAHKRLNEGCDSTPEDTSLICGIGKCYMAENKLAEAKTAFIKALQINPHLADAHYALGTIMRNWNQLDEAIQCYRTVLRLHPHDINSLVNLGEVLQRSGYIGESESCFREVLSSAPHCRPAQHNLLVSISYNPVYSQKELLNAHQEWGNQLPPPPSPSPLTIRNTNTLRDKIHIGYCSPDFCNHPAGAFLLPMLHYHDTHTFELFCYSQTIFDDARTDQFRRLAQHWCSIESMDDTTVASKIRNDGIDILIDTAGHFYGNRLEMMALHPAQVQISAIGYPGPTGCPAIPYRISDTVLDPPGQDSVLLDSPLRLDPCFCCYTPPDPMPHITLLPARKNGYITFGSLHTTARLTKVTIQLWGKILTQVAGSMLHICRDTISPSIIKQITGWFSELNISPDRILFKSEIPEAGHLSFYNYIDISLDTTPWSGHTTACESLIMGVPVITFSGERYCSRMVASILKTVGLDTLVADTEATFISTAVHLAENYSELAELRMNLRGMVLASPLCDGQSYMKILEKKIITLL